MQSPKNFVIYKSSAGSGKTFTLVREYLSIVLKDPGSFRHILAITFTIKAAAEMKERVISYLKILAEPEQHAGSAVVKALLPQLEEATGMNKDAIRINATKVLKLIMHNYSDFAIGTIDSFFYKVFRTFARDMDLPVNFEVELDKENMLTQIVDMLISRVGQDEDLSRVLMEFVKSKAEEERSWHIEKDIHKFSSTLFKEESGAFVEKIQHLTLKDFEVILQQVSALIKAFEKDVGSLAGDAYQLLLDNNLEPGMFYQGKNGIMTWFGNLADGNMDKLPPNSHVLKTIEDDKWTGGKADTADKESINAIKDRLSEAYHDIHKLRDEREAQYWLLRLVARDLYPLAVLNEVARLIVEYREEYNFIHISEINKRIAALVKEPVPFIYERLGVKYIHFLLDEFQDTSVLQWHNLLPLVENAVSGATFSLVVGDGKQAIYRFRAGEVEQFEMLPQVIKKDKDAVTREREKVLIDNAEIRNLDANYRSRAGIVEFNNSFFKYISDYLPDDLKSIYKGLEQKYDKNDKGGFISLEFLEQDDKDVYENENFQRISGIISELTEDGFQLRDIAILCRDNKSASKIARYLIMHDIDVVSFESLLLNTSPKVNFIISWMYYLLNNDDEVSRTAILNFLISSNRIPNTTLNQTLSLFKTGKDSNSAHFSFVKLLERSRFKAKGLNKLNIYELTEELTRVFELDDVVDPYLMYFQDTVLDQLVKQHINTDMFLEWWEDHKGSLSVIVPEGVNAVRVMTIHKAKGLEFPVVIYPFAKQSFRVTKNELWVDLDVQDLPELPSALLLAGNWMEKTKFKGLKEEEDHKSRVDLLNILYVVMTRPVERLYLLTVKKTKKIEKITDVPSLFYSYLSGMGLWEENQLVYTFGEKLRYIKEQGEEQAGQQVLLKEYYSNAWRDRVLLSLSAPGYWDMEDPEKNRQWGNTIHFILSKIHKTDDLEDVISDLASQGIIIEDEVAAIREKLSYFLNDPAITPFFSSDWVIKNEAEILLPDGSSYRPDRLLFKGKEVKIIDFKTGAPAEGHKDQLRKYAKALSDMGYVVVGMFLLYLDADTKVMPIKG